MCGVQVYNTQPGDISPRKAEMRADLGNGERRRLKQAETVSASCISEVSATVCIGGRTQWKLAWHRVHSYAACNHTMVVLMHS